jgi:hypothetical protein
MHWLLHEQATTTVVRNFLQLFNLLGGHFGHILEARKAIIIVLEIHYRV